LLTGYGPTARQRPFIARGTPVTRSGAPGRRLAPSAEQLAEQMKVHAKAIGDLLGSDDH
jgi:hypothetical protein